MTGEALSALEFLISTRDKAHKLWAELAAAVLEEVPYDQLAEMIREQAIILHDLNELLAIQAEELLED